jgi:type 2 lantibiotic biosynthesis protein LanM
VESGSSIENKKQLFSESCWYHALTLTERIVEKRTSSDEAMNCQEGQLAQATKRLEQWKKQPAFLDSELFEDRLTMDGVTEQELLMLLAETMEDIQKRFMEQDTPVWISELQYIWETYAPGREEARLASDPEAGNPSGAPELLDVFKPLIELGCSLLRQGVEQLRDASQNLPFESATVHQLFLPNLQSHLHHAAIRALVLEMHIARLQGQLTGDTPEERFRNFLHQSSQPSHLYAFLSQYPLLARKILTIIHHWADYGLEIVQHLCNDWREICRVFAQEAELGNLVEVQTGAGDTHRGGRSVAILRFSSGFQLVYKPRALSLDQHFQELLVWVNTLGIARPLRPLTILGAENHGWVEFVQTHECSTQAEISRFYERQGYYLALLYALDAADFHHENLLAAGEHPILVDLEALFHARLGEYDPNKAGSAGQSIGYSVLRTGLLPSRMYIEEGKAGIDVSGLGGKEGQMTPWAVPVWKEGGTDQMRLKREHRTMSGAKNRPGLPGQDVETTDYIPDILKGFTEMYRLLVSHQEEWITQILPRFEHDEVRVILRATRTYGLLLSESYHPEHLRDAFEHERLFDHLWDGVSFMPHLHRVIVAERKDMMQGDVPYFTTQAGSRDIFTSQGERIADFCSASGMECVKRRIKKMDESDLTLQQWIIRASLVTTLMGDKRAPRVSFPSSSSLTVNREQLMQAAEAVGERLNTLAIRGERGANWLGIDAVTESEDGVVWQLQASSLGLYDGLAGIILFLSYLGKVTGEARYLDLADLALLSLEEQIETGKKFKVPQGMGAFTGPGSLIYLFSHLSVLRGETSFLQQAQDLVEEVEPLVEKDKQLDIIAGSAGSIACLLALYHLAPSPRTLEVAIRCGDHLLAHAHELEGGLGWYTIRQNKGTAGFSHGAAGIALSLFQLAEASQQDRFHQAALAALAFEQSLFSAEEGNWARISEQGELDYPVSWCHGAPGVGLARLAALRYHDDAQIRQEIQVALETTLTKGFGNNQSICHGDLGNLETVLIATQMLGTPRYHEELKRLTALIYDGIQEHGWVTGVPLGVETPGLMSGLAGIGYELLRLAAPESVPSVLLLAPPLSAV